MIHPSLWKRDVCASQCEKCSRAFSLIHRRHHCRHCGHIFCDACSSVRLWLHAVKQSRYDTTLSPSSTLSKEWSGLQEDEKEEGLRSASASITARTAPSSSPLPAGSKSSGGYHLDQLKKDEERFSVDHSSQIAGSFPGLRGEERGASGSPLGAADAASGSTQHRFQEVLFSHSSQAQNGTPNGSGDSQPDSYLGSSINTQQKFQQQLRSAHQIATGAPRISHIEAIPWCSSSADDVHGFAASYSKLPVSGKRGTRTVALPEEAEEAAAQEKDARLWWTRSAAAERRERGEWRFLCRVCDACSTLLAVQGDGKEGEGEGRSGSDVSPEAAATATTEASLNASTRSGNPPAEVVRSPVTFGFSLVRSPLVGPTESAPPLESPIGGRDATQFNMSRSGASSSGVCSTMWNTLKAQLYSSTSVVTTASVGPSDSRTTIEEVGSPVKVTSSSLTPTLKATVSDGTAASTSSTTTMSTSSKPTKMNELGATGTPPPLTVHSMATLSELTTLARRQRRVCIILFDERERESDPVMPHIFAPTTASCSSAASRHGKSSPQTAASSMTSAAISCSSTVMTSHRRHTQDGASDILRSQLLLFPSHPPSPIVRHSSPSTAPSANSSATPLGGGGGGSYVQVDSSCWLSPFARTQALLRHELPRTYDRRVHSGYVLAALFDQLRSSTAAAGNSSNVSPMQYASAGARPVAISSLYHAGSSSSSTSAYHFPASVAAGGPSMTDPWSYEHRMRGVSEIDRSTSTILTQQQQRAHIYFGDGNDDAGEVGHGGGTVNGSGHHYADPALMSTASTVWRPPQRSIALQIPVTLMASPMPVSGTVDGARTSSFSRRRQQQKMVPQVASCMTSSSSITPGVLRSAQQRKSVKRGAGARAPCLDASTGKVRYAELRNDLNVNLEVIGLSSTLVRSGSGVVGMDVTRVHDMEQLATQLTHASIGVDGYVVVVLRGGNACSTTSPPSAPYGVSGFAGTIIAPTVPSTTAAAVGLTGRGRRTDSPSGMEDSILSSRRGAAMAGITTPTSIMGAASSSAKTTTPFSGKHLYALYQHLSECGGQVPPIAIVDVIPNSTKTPIEHNHICNGYVAAENAAANSESCLSSNANVKDNNNGDKARPYPEPLKLSTSISSAGQESRASNNSAPQGNLQKMHMSAPTITAAAASIAYPISVMCPARSRLNTRAAIQSLQSASKHMGVSYSRKYYPEPTGPAPTIQRGSTIESSGAWAGGDLSEDAAFPLLQHPVEAVVGLILQREQRNGFSS